MDEMNVDLTTVSGIVGAVLFALLVIRCTVVEWVKRLFHGGVDEAPGWDHTGRPTS